MSALSSVGLVFAVVCVLILASILLARRAAKNVEKARRLRTDIERSDRVLDSLSRRNRGRDLLDSLRGDG